MNNFNSNSNLNSNYSVNETIFSGTVKVEGFSYDYEVFYDRFGKFVLYSKDFSFISVYDECPTAEVAEGDFYSYIGSWILEPAAEVKEEVENNLTEILEKDDEISLLMENNLMSYEVSYDRIGRISVEYTLTADYGLVGSTYTDEVVEVSYEGVEEYAEGLIEDIKSDSAYMEIVEGIAAE